MVRCPSVRPSVCPSVHPTLFVSHSPLQQCVVCCCGPSWQGKSMITASTGRCSSTALSSKCGQCHVYSKGMRLSGDLLLISKSLFADWMRIVTSLFTLIKGFNDSQCSRSWRNLGKLSQLNARSSATTDRSHKQATLVEILSTTAQPTTHFTAIIRLKLH